jgi:peroxiredoxin
MVAVSPQTPDQSQAMLLKNFLKYEVLSDLGNRVSRTYGLVYPVGAELRKVYQSWGVELPKINADDSWELPLPGTFIIDRNGIVKLAFVDADYTRRLDPAEIMAQLEKMREDKV